MCRERTTCDALLGGGEGLRWWTGSGGGTETNGGGGSEIYKGRVVEGQGQETESIKEE